MRWLLLCAAVIALPLFTVTVAASSPAPLQERMTAQEFRAAGLDKLDADELAALNAWLQGATTRPGAPTAAKTGVAPAQVAVPEGYSLVKTDSVTKPKHDDADRSDVISEIEGPFSGWSGATIFRLRNGQVWQQDDRTTLRLKERTGVSVRIKSGLMGNWRMKVDGSNQWVQVKRLQ